VYARGKAEGYTRMSGFPRVRNPRVAIVRVYIVPHCPHSYP